MISIYKESPEHTRLIFDYLFKNYPEIAWENLQKRDYEKIYDVLWNLPKEKINESFVKNDNFLSELYSAKRYFDFKKSSSVFELDVILNLKKDIADIDFEYLCSECKNIFPFAFSRCPNCLEPKGAIAEFVLTKKREINEENISI